ncbi:MAG: CGNR zinc finger domain-containing protein [Gemmatimonadaceae bacterium]|jgi:predicted RNA-binding Zn ribbon-like protein|nr:CGNR zinc finger domain-containing protein [Gemmatimonadaceae bacterium]
MPASPTSRERLWLAFVNADALASFDRLLAWMHAAGVLDADRHASIGRRATLQPAAAAAALIDARRMYAALRTLADRGAADLAVRDASAGEINRVLGRSTGVRRLEQNATGAWRRTFSTVGDAFAGLLLPVAESAADALVSNEIARIRRCASASCGRVFLDQSRGGRRRWCAMATCGNRAKVRALRARRRPAHGERARTRSAA